MRIIQNDQIFKTFTQSEPQPAILLASVLMEAWISSNVFPFVSGTSLATKRTVIAPTPEYKKNVPEKQTWLQFSKIAYTHFIKNFQIIVESVKILHLRSSSSSESWKCKKLPKHRTSSLELLGFQPLPLHLLEKSVGCKTWLFS